jgi:hypothetical protein
LCRSVVAVPGGVGVGGGEVASPAEPGDDVRGGFGGGPVLPLPAHRRLRGLWLGLDNRAEEVRRELLLGEVSVRLPPEVPAQPHRPAGESLRRGRALLRRPQNVLHLHAIL